MKIKAEIVADSKNESGDRITTMVVTFPRFILAELNTHRMFSRNSASSRAIPFEKMINSVKENPFIPIAWQKDHKGMQGTEYFTEKDTIDQLQSYWLKARDEAVNWADGLNNIGLTKQLCNRVLEPFMWHTVLVTATEWENFFALRCPQYQSNDEPSKRSKKDYINSYKEWALDCSEYSELEWLQLNKGQAEIHMMALAEAMWDALNESIPQELKAGEWHIPFGDDITNEALGENLYHIGGSNDHLRIKIATARCARVSYTVVGEEGKEANYENDLKLHNRLAESGHWSPFEHSARAMNPEEYEEGVNGKVEQIGEFLVVDDKAKGWSGNFKGFIQYRKTFKNENIT